MTTEMWQDVRLLMYPVMIVGGIAWALGFWLRFKTTLAAGDKWAGRLGAAVALYGVLSMAGLILAREFGYGAQTAPLVSLGVVAIALVVAWGALRLFVGGWRRPGPASTGSADDNGEG